MPQLQQQARRPRSHFHSRPVLVTAISMLPLASRKATGAPRCSMGSMHRPLGLSTCPAGACLGVQSLVAPQACLVPVCRLPGFCGVFRDGSRKGRKYGRAVWQ